MFGSTGNVREEFINMIETSIVERLAAVCDT